MKTAITILLFSLPLFLSATATNFSPFGNGGKAKVKSQYAPCRETPVMTNYHDIPHLSAIPNTSNGSFAVSYELNVPSIIHAKVYNILGALVYEKSDTKVAGKNTDGFEVGFLSQGVYLIEYEFIFDNNASCKAFTRVNLMNSNAGAKYHPI